MADARARVDASARQLLAVQSQADTVAALRQALGECESRLALANERLLETQTAHAQCNARIAALEETERRLTETVREQAEELEELENRAQQKPRAAPAAEAVAQSSMAPSAESPSAPPLSRLASISGLAAIATDASTIELLRQLALSETARLELEESARELTARANAADAQVTAEREAAARAVARLADADRRSERAAAEQHRIALAIDGMQSAVNRAGMKGAVGPDTLHLAHIYCSYCC